VAGSVSLVLLSLGVAYHIRVYEPFYSRERFARARIRRHECVICGTKLRGIPDEICTDCREPEAVSMATGD